MLDTIATIRDRAPKLATGRAVNGEVNISNSMKAKEIISGAKQWTAKIRIENPRYVSLVDVTTWAPNMATARNIFKSQYNIQDWHIGSIKQVQ